MFLNHLYTMADPATVTALQQNAFLKNEFVDVEVRTTVRPDTTYTGTYLNGATTYLEFFPTGTFGYPQGVTGIALGTEGSAGDDDALRTTWSAAFDGGVSPVTPISRDVDGVNTPWFDLVAPTYFDTSDYTALWSMQYVPNAGGTAPRTRVEERAVRYAPGKLMHDVTSALIQLPAADLAAVRTALRSAGWRVSDEGQGGFAARSPKDHGVRRVLRFRLSTEAWVGLRGLSFDLNRTVAPKVEKLGSGWLFVGSRGGKDAQLWLAKPTFFDLLLLELP